VVALVVGIFAVYQHIAGQLSGTNTVDGSLPDDVRAADLPEYTGKGIICGLVCGLDYDNETADGYEDPDNKIGNTDLILYVMFDTVNGSANILQIPRDIYVGDELATGGNYKINSLYRFSEDPDNRIAPLARAINDQLKLPIDFYITIDMDAVKAIVDHMGTLEVYVPRDVVDPENPGNVLEEGWRHFTGEEAEFFLRNRNYVDGDVTRLAMQQSFYSALFREFKRLTPTDLLIWMRIVLYYVNVEGISLVEIGGLGQKALGLTSEDITFVRPPVIGTKYKGKALVYLDADETAELLNQYFRPDGHGYTAEELNIFTLDTDLYGKSEAQIISMASIQGQEAPHQ
ncbi:LCP family protein, partial [Ruminococcaceae bacterium OttesenSCG-928-O06]|nr:LCP family protein [Ruminococcaceae bacterium OttesenSCG-928-O06]